LRSSSSIAVPTTSGVNENQHERHDEHRPHEHRQAIERHPRRAHAHDADDQFRRRADGRDFRDAQPDIPEIHVDAGRELLVVQREIGEPPAIRRGADDEAGVQKDSAKQVRPVTQRRQARERQIARPQLQREQIRRQRLDERDDDQEHHGRPVHREQLVVRLGRQECVARRAELNAQQQRLHTTDQKEHARRDQVALRDRDVVDRAQRADHAARLIPGALERLDLGRGSLQRRHPLT
jgi:hypothetical protein